MTLCARTELVGSIRIHTSVCRIMFSQKCRLSPEMQDSFKHLTDALGHGCPPHGGKADVIAG